MRRSCALVSLFLALMLFSGPAGPAQVSAEESPTASETADATQPESAEPKEISYEEIPMEAQIRYSIDNIVLFFCAVLVIFMQAGFAMVESGFNSQKNTVNILFKNTMDLSIGVLLFWIVGYKLMYPGDEAIAAAGQWFAYGGGIGADESLAAAEVAPGTLFPQADFLFQVAFAATAATIVSGAVAGRMKFAAYLVYSAVITALIYPISGMWKWGGGWLGHAGDDAGVAQFAGVYEWFGAPFHDFAGSLVVHAVGGFAGLAGAIVLGPRIGRYSADGKPHAMPGHSMPLATLGVFILLVGWYGFNPGSQLVFSDAASVNTTMTIATNTTLAACAGGFSAMLLAWVLYKKPDLSMALNGILGGLVGITANCDQVTNASAITIGLIAGGLVILGVVALDKFRVDDPVGAFPVHGLCGVWGGVATGVFGTTEKLSMASQVVGSLAIAGWAFVTMFTLFNVLKIAGILRVSPEEEVEGLDIGEHGMHAYSTE